MDPSKSIFGSLPSDRLLLTSSVTSGTGKKGKSEDQTPTSHSSKRKRIDETAGKNMEPSLPSRPSNRKRKVQNATTSQFRWNKRLDKLLLKVIRANGGPGNWEKVAESVPGKVGFQCESRWHNVLQYDKTTPVAPKEIVIINQLAATRMSWLEISNAIKHILGIYRHPNDIANIHCGESRLPKITLQDLPSTTLDAFLSTLPLPIEGQETDVPEEDRPKVAFDEIDLTAQEEDHVVFPGVDLTFGELAHDDLKAFS